MQNKLFIKKVFLLISFLSLGVLSMPSECFLVGDDLYYENQKIPLSFRTERNLEEYASSGNGNVAFFNITWKTTGSLDINFADIEINEKIIGFVSNWQGSVPFFTSMQANANIKNVDLLNAYQQRGHEILETGSLNKVKLKDLLPNQAKYYELQKTNCAMYNFPYNFKHSEHYFLDFLFKNKASQNILKTTDPIEFALLKVISTNSSCNNCFKSLWTLISGEKTCHSLPPLKSDFMNIFFGENATVDTPLHILYTTAKFPSYRNGELTELWKNTPESIDLEGSDPLFIQRCFPLDQEKKKPIKAVFPLQYYSMEVTFKNPKEAIIGLYKDNHQKSGQLEEKDLLLKKSIQLLAKTQTAEEIAEALDLIVDVVKEYLQ